MKTSVKSRLASYGASGCSYTNTCQSPSSAAYNTVVDASKSSGSSYHSGYRSLATQNYRGTYQGDLNIDRDYDHKVVNNTKG